jgi:excisionase family DNA binding protein
MDADERLIDVPTAAARLGISRHTVRAWIRAGRLPHVRLGRRVLLQVTELDAFVRAHAVRASENRGNRAV